MTPEILLVYGFVLLALVLFAADRLPVDAVAIGVLVALAVTGLVSPQEALAGFSNVATVTVAAMFVLSAGLRRTGALAGVGTQLARLGERSELLALTVLMVLVAVVSGFINNTAAVAIFIPVVIDLGHRMGISPSRLLIPLSFASMFGGVSTLIGTSTNLLVDAIAAERGLDRFGMFEFMPLGLGLFAIGFVYLLIVRHRIPARRPAEDEDLTDRFDVGAYLARIELDETGPGVGVALGDDPLDGFGIEVVDVEREGRTRAGIEGTLVLASGDVLRVQGGVDALRRLSQADGVRLVEATGGDKLDAAISTRDETLVEAVLAPDSALSGQTTAELDLAARHGAQALGLRQAGELRHDLPDITLRSGDTLLLKIDRDRVPNLRADKDFIVVSEVETTELRTGRMPAALGIVAAVVLLAATGMLPIVAAALAGALAMVATGALTGEEAYDAINWKVVMLLAGVIPLGTALESTGGAALLADVLVQRLSAWGPVAVLGGIFLLTQLVTSVISNNASAVLFAPIAIGAAENLGADPRPFLFAVTVAASMSFLTPVGYQTNTMIYGPGQYRFSDFLRIGGPLTLLVLVAATLLIPVLWPL
jgi:di/tricarboxylate transporter